MKNLFKISALSFLLAVLSPAYAQEAFIPLKEGAVLEYMITDSKGKTAGYSVNTIQSVEGCGEDCFFVTYSSASLDKNGKDKEKTSIMTVKVKNGGLYSDPSLFVLYGGNTISGDVSVLPAVLNTGDILNDYTWNIKIGIVSAAITVARQRVSAVEKVTVPAGTFVCVKVDGVSEINTLGLKITNNTETWYAPGIGPVRSDVYDHKGKLRQSRVLVKFSE